MKTALWGMAALLLMGCEKATYSVDGAGEATVTYYDGGEVKEKVALPWKKEVTASSKLKLEAEGDGDLNCSIEQKGKGIRGSFGKGSCTAE